MIVIELSQISKVTQGKRLLKNISLEIEEGMIYGLIGSDHSRKSLLIKQMLGLVKKSEGNIKYFGQTFKRDHLLRIGSSIDSISFYNQLTAYDNILYYLEPYKKRFSELELDVNDQIMKYFSLFNLESNLYTSTKKYSLGMLQKLRVIRALIIEPDILILDEPAKSLDPVSIKILKNELRQRASRGKTIFIATSMLSFISDLADELGVLHYGELIDEITSDDRKKDQQAYLSIKSLELPKLIMVIERELSIFDYEVISDKQIHILEDYLDSDKIVATLVKNKVSVLEVKRGYVSLEAFFLEKIGE